jgi:uncharacterized protein YggT (Ycf19 family)
MSYHFEFDSTNRILRVGFEGPVTDQILTEFYAGAGEYVARTLPRGAIIDFSAVTSFVVASSTVFILARSTPVMEDHKTIRVIVAPGEQVFGISRIFQILGESTRPALRLVRSLEEAFAMFEIRDPRFEPVRLE